MSDYISRQAAIDELIRKMQPHNNGDGTITICVMSEALVTETLNNLPSAQPEREKAEWKEVEGDLVTCSRCHHYWIRRGDQYDFNFCPTCGADMRGGDKC